MRQGCRMRQPVFPVICESDGPLALVRRLPTVGIQTKCFPFRKATQSWPLAVFGHISWTVVVVVLNHPTVPDVWREHATQLQNWWYWHSLLVSSSRDHNGCFLCSLFTQILSVNAALSMNTTPSGSVRMKEGPWVPSAKEGLPCTYPGFLVKLLVPGFARLVRKYVL